MVLFGNSSDKVERQIVVEIGNDTIGAIEVPGLTVAPFAMELPFAMLLMCTLPTPPTTPASSSSDNSCGTRESSDAETAIRRLLLKNTVKPPDTQRYIDKSKYTRWCQGVAKHFLVYIVRTNALCYNFRYASFFLMYLYFEEDRCMAAEYLQQTLSGMRATKDFYTPREVAEIYHVTPQTVSGWCRNGILKADKREAVSKKAKGKGHRWHIFPSQIEDIETVHRDALIEASRKYWMRLYVKMHNG